MSTPSKSTLRKIADEVVLSSWAQELVAQVQSRSLEALTEAGFRPLELANKAMVSMLGDAIRLVEEWFFEDPVMGERLLLRTVLTVELEQSSLGGASCHVAVRATDALSLAAPFWQANLVAVGVFGTDGLDDLRLEVDVVKATVDYIAQGFAQVDESRVGECACLLTSQLMNVLSH